MRRSVTHISHDYIVESMTRCTCRINVPMVGGSISRSRLFALKSSQRSSDRIRVELIGAYTWHTTVSKDLTLTGMAGVVTLKSSVDVDIGPSPGRLTASMIGLLSSRERKAVIQFFFDLQTFLPNLRQ